MTAALHTLHVRPIEVFEITDEAGNTIDTARIVERWQGMARLVTDKGLMAIVEMPAAFQEAPSLTFGRIFPPGSRSTLSCSLVKASPALMAQLAAAAAPGAPAAWPAGK